MIADSSGDKKKSERGLGVFRFGGEALSQEEISALSSISDEQLDALSALLRGASIKFQDELSLWGFSEAQQDLIDTCGR